MALHAFTRLKTSLNLALFRVRAKLEPLSEPLQFSLRLVRHPLPAYPTALLTDCLPVAVTSNQANNRAYRVPLQLHEQRRFCLSTGGHKTA